MDVFRPTRFGKPCRIIRLLTLFGMTNTFYTTDTWIFNLKKEEREKFIENREERKYTLRILDLQGFQNLVGL